MSDKPSIFGHCKAGCLWETVHRDDFLKSASIAELSLTEAAEGIEPLRKYKIYSATKTGIETLSATLSDELAQRSGVSVCAVGKNIYLFGGSDIYVLDTAAGTITNVGSLPNAASYIGVAAVGTKVYLFGGNDGSAYSNLVQVFDTTTNTVSTLSVTLTAGMSQIAAVTVGTKIYLFGGDDGSTNSNLVQVFDTTTNTLSTLSVTLPVTPARIDAAAIGQKIYLACFTSDGYGVGGNHIRIFDTTTNTFTTKEQTDITAYILTDKTMVAVGETLYFIGGGGMYKFAWKYDTVTEEFSGLSVAPWTDRDISLYAAAIGQKIYLFGKPEGVIYYSEVRVFHDTAPESLVMLSDTDLQYVLPLDKGDEYRDYFSFEIVALKVNDAATEMTIVYEVNGERHIVVVGGENLDATACKLVISGATALYVYNDGAVVQAKDGEKGEKGENAKVYRHSLTFTLSSGAKIQTVVHSSREGEIVEVIAADFTDDSFQPCSYIASGSSSISGIALIKSISLRSDSIFEMVMTAMIHNWETGSIETITDMDFTLKDAVTEV